MANDSVTDVVLHARSIGGVASGISTAEEALVQLGRAKNLVAYTDTTMCSAMYWLGCIADKVYTAKANISVGSIGIIYLIIRYKTHVLVIPCVLIRQRTLDIQHSNVWVRFVLCY